MKISTTKEWFQSRAPLEEGLEVGAGSIPSVGKSESQLATEYSAISIAQHLSFGRFVELMRRKRQWTIEELAEEAEATCEELLSIENDAHYEPEPSTVYGVATSFGVPAKSLYKMAGLADNSSTRIREDSIRFAACSESKEPLTEDEEVALQAIIKVLVEESD